MKIFGFEVAYKSTTPQIDRDTLDALLDAMHGSLSADEHLYSADLVAEGPERVTVLLGVQVSDAEGMDEADRYAQAAMGAAFAAGGAQAHAMNTVSRSVRELVAV